MSLLYRIRVDLKRIYLIEINIYIIILQLLKKSVKGDTKEVYLTLQVIEFRKVQKSLYLSNVYSSLIITSIKR